jgi:hypothetical protein
MCDRYREYFSATSQLPYYHPKTDLNLKSTIASFRPVPAIEPRRLYFDKLQTTRGAWGDPGTVVPQDIDEPLARDVAFLVRNRHQPSMNGHVDEISMKVLEKQHPLRFNVDQPLGAIGLNQDRIAKLVLKAEDINGIYYGI